MIKTLSYSTLILILVTLWSYLIVSFLESSFNIFHWKEGMVILTLITAFTHGVFGILIYLFVTSKLGK